MDIPINDCGEALVPIPDQIIRMLPHLYTTLGAPYGENLGPWWLRDGVVNRLLDAQSQLKRIYPSYSLAVFDAWRPISVLEFMINHAIETECEFRGIDINLDFRFFK